jgi:hypothetical protein
MMTTPIPTRFQLQMDNSNPFSTSMFQDLPDGILGVQMDYIYHLHFYPKNLELM